MKALLLTAPSRLEIADVPCPDVGPHDVQVRVAACGICGSDVHGYDGSSGRRIPPLVMGHEAAGVVERVGTEVKRFVPGDRVTFDSMFSNPASWYSRRGLAHLCDDRRVMGVSCGDYRQHGAFAELVSVPEHIVYRVPDALSLEHAALIEPVSIAVHAMRRAVPQLGDSALVVGAGMIGLLCVQSLRAGGAGLVIASDPDATRRERALAAGADVAVDPEAENVAERCRELTEGRGTDLAMEAVGATGPVNTAIQSVRKGGVVVLIGNVQPRVEIGLQDVVTRELSLRGTCGSNGEYPACLELMARGKIQVADCITAVDPLEKGPEWFQRLHAREPGVLKVLLHP
ncbi:MAG: galactitol-1-phosphate 5-dehydrogenase [Planctomycetales bacterium]|nr:galactitol-1-phosphate 5-dehydrogenase [Planctomycetales bacterium]